MLFSIYLASDPANRPPTTMLGAVRSSVHPLLHLDHLGHSCVVQKSAGPLAWGRWSRSVRSQAQGLGAGFVSCPLMGQWRTLRAESRFLPWGPWK